MYSIICSEVTFRFFVIHKVEVSINPFMEKITVLNGYSYDFFSVIFVESFTFFWLLKKYISILRVGPVPTLLQDLPFANN